jgi:hypothetical protein
VIVRLAFSDPQIPGCTNPSERGRTTTTCRLRPEALRGEASTDSDKALFVPISGEVGARSEQATGMPSEADRMASNVRRMA